MKLADRLASLTALNLTHARNWIADCSWADLDNVEELTDLEIVRGVAAHYAGGWDQFLADTREEVQPIYPIACLMTVYSQPDDRPLFNSVLPS